ncbi:MAG TPA: RNA polymerase sigma factor [Phycisphaerales bacterium]|nr:RNA polymerase sigma factor [Phycisphaerales bacterium]
MDGRQITDLLEQHRRPLWGIAVAIVRDRALADDVVQDAAVIALQKAAEFDPATNFLAWASQIVRYTALNQRRKVQRDPVVPAGSLEHNDRPGASPLSALDRAETNERLERALDTLDETPRACVVLRGALGLSYKEIAAALSIPEGTAMSHFFRASRALRAALSDETEPRP